MKMRVTLEMDFGRRELPTVPEYASHLRLLAERPDVFQGIVREVPELVHVVAAWIVQEPRKGGAIEP